MCKLKRITGRQVFLRDLHRQVDAMRGQGRRLPANINETMFRSHTERWKRLREDQRMLYARRAANVREEEEEESLRRRRDTLLQEVQDLEVALHAQKQDDHPARLGNCRFTPGFLVELESLASLAQFSMNEVQRLRRMSSEVFRSPPAIALRALEAIEPPERRKRPALPSWVRLTA